MIPVFDFSKLISLGKTIILTILLWKAFKLLMIGSISVLVPYAIYKGYGFLGEQTFNLMKSTLSGSAWEGTFVQLSGLAGWIGQRLRLQECFQIMASFLSIRYFLSFFKKD